MNVLCNVRARCNKRRNTAKSEKGSEVLENHDRAYRKGKWYIEKPAVLSILALFTHGLFYSSQRYVCTLRPSSGVCSSGFPSGGGELLKKSNVLRLSNGLISKLPEYYLDR